MDKLPLYILAGGRSSRFGSDKARAELGGRPLVRRIADALAPVADPVRVVAGPPGGYADLGFVTIADRRPDLRPLAGLEMALLDRQQLCGTGWLILCSCPATCWRFGLGGSVTSVRIEATTPAPSCSPTPTAIPSPCWPCITRICCRGSGST